MGNNIKIEICKSNVFYILAILFIVIFCLYVIFRPNKGVPDVIDSDVRFEVQFQERLHQLMMEKEEYAESLSKERRHKEASIIFLELAAARECLFPDNRQHLSTPTITELRALREFRGGFNLESIENMGVDAYITILKLKYPDWQEN